MACVNLKDYQKTNILNLLYTQGFLSLLLISEYVFGDVFLLVCFFVFSYVVGRRIYDISMKWREIFLSQMLSDHGLFFRIIMNLKVFATLVAVFTAMVVSLGFFILFYTVGYPYKIVIFADSLIMLFLIKKVNIPFGDEVKDNVYPLLCQLCGNFCNIVILFLLYLAYSLSTNAAYLNNFTPGVLDVNIPLWIGENVFHSSHFFQRILRISWLLNVTIDNMLMLDGVIHEIYKVAHLLTMSFFPFLGLTIFNRVILDSSKINYAK